MTLEQIRQALTARPMAGPSGLWSVAKHASGGRLGFDPARNPSTSKKAACIEYITSSFPTAAVEAAIMATAEGTPNNQPTKDTPKAPAMNRQLPFSEPAPAPKAGQTPAAAPQEAAAQLAGFIAQLAGANAAPIDAEAVRKIAQEAAAEALAKIGALPTRVEIKTPETPEWKSAGVQHHAFPDLLMASAARVNTLLVGPAGTGKSTAALKVAETLGLRFVVQPPVDSKHELFGYTDAQGRAVWTPFRDAFTNGGVLILEEMDASYPPALIAMNGALANRVCQFPGEDKPTQMHPDFIAIGNANTKGQGADANYTGRARQDMAALDRFTPIDWPHDDALERALCPNALWVTRVQAARAWAARQQIKGARITTRASIVGAQLLAAGFTLEKADAATWGASLTTEQIESARRSLPLWTVDEIKAA